VLAVVLDGRFARQLVVIEHLPEPAGDGNPPPSNSSRDRRARRIVRSLEVFARVGITPSRVPPDPRIGARKRRSAISVVVAA
jgi:hypothetical protein